MQQSRLRQIALDEAYPFADFFRLPCKQLSGKGERLGVDIQAGNVEALAGKKNLDNAFAAPDVQNPLTPSLIHHPIDSSTKDFARSAPLQRAEIDLCDAIPLPAVGILYWLGFHADPLNYS